jgi:hypothetical protein
MNICSKRMMRGIGALAAIWLSLTTATAQTATARIVSAANTFLSALSEKQRQSVMYSFGDEQQRARWSNFPTGFVPRGGMSLKEMTARQRAAAMALVSSALSKRGFEKVQQIMEGDEVNKIEEAKNGNRPPRGTAGHRQGMVARHQAPEGRPPAAERIGHRSAADSVRISLAKIFTTSPSWVSPR